jgi:hypothetical protein
MSATIVSSRRNDGVFGGRHGDSGGPVRRESQYVRKVHVKSHQAAGLADADLK